MTGALLLGVSSSHATLLAYDGFQYTAGTGIGGQSGGDSFGWGGAWGNSGAGFLLGTNVAGNLNYTDAQGNQLAVDNASGSIIVGVPNLLTGNGTTASPQRQIGNFNSSPSAPGQTNQLANGTYWISYLSQWIGPGYGAPANPTGYAALGGMGLYSGVVGAGTGGTERFDVGGVSGAVVSNSYTAWVGNGKTGNPNNSPNSPISTNLPYALNTTTFVLMELVTGPTNVVVAGTTPTDTLYYWFNWTNLLVMPTLDTASGYSTNEAFLSDVDGLRLAANNANATRTNALIQYDEVRVGTTFGDVAPVVAPEPTSIALAMLGGAGMLSFMRRRKKA